MLAGLETAEEYKTHREDEAPGLSNDLNRMVGIVVLVAMNKTLPQLDKVPT